MTVLGDEHIKLVPVTPRHEEVFLQLANHPRIYRRINKPHPYTKNDFGSLLKQLASAEAPAAYFCWMIEAKGGDICGCINTGALRHPKVFQGGYWLRPDKWGKGLATRAVLNVKRFLLDEMAAQRIQALVEPDNAPSIQVLEKSGYQREGLLRRFYPSRHAGLLDVYMYAVTTPAE